MGYLEDDMDIAGTIKIIDKLKSQLLLDVAQLFSQMDNDENRNNEKGDLLADITILSYLLSTKLGISYEQIDRRIIRKIRLGLIDSEQGSKWNKDLLGLLRHFE